MKANKKINRRQFTRSASIAGASILLPGIAFSQIQQRQRVQQRQRLQQNVGPSLQRLAMSQNKSLSAEEKAMADDIVKKIKHQMAVAISNPQMNYAQPYANLGKELTTKVFRAKQTQSINKARSLLSQPAQFGRYATATASVYQQRILPAAMSADLFKGKMNKSISKLQSSNSLVKPIGSGLSRQKLRKNKPDLPKLNVERYHSIGLYLEKMLCKDETDWESGSADEILISTASYLADGSSNKGQPWKISDDFDKGETVKFVTPQNPNGRLLSQLSIDPITGIKRPYDYAWLMVMAEEDDGGFAEILRKLWDAVDEEVKKYVTKAAMAGIGAAIGSIWPGIGTAIGALIGYILGAIADWLINLFDNQDDLIAEQTVNITLYDNSKTYFQQSSWKGPKGPAFSLNFNGDGGRYQGTFRLMVS